ncbi:hypothetical protein GCM10007978_46260 [Shewanella hanedai]|nr:hypothetical protein GCM10007978_46260 [Shewanella hanedai]
MNSHNTINYLELPVKDIEKTKQFFSQVFGWGFIDYGPSTPALPMQGLQVAFISRIKALIWHVAVY